jgi:hypothetical protein
MKGRVKNYLVTAGLTTSQIQARNKAEAKVLFVQHHKPYFSGSEKFTIESKVKINKNSTIELLEQIPNPTEEQIYLINYVKKLIEEPETRINKQLISECVGVVWLMVK